MANQEKYAQQMQDAGVYDSRGGALRHGEGAAGRELAWCCSV